MSMNAYQQCLQVMTIGKALEQLSGTPKAPKMVPEGHQIAYSEIETAIAQLLGSLGGRYWCLLTWYLQ